MRAHCGGKQISSDRSGLGEGVGVARIAMWSGPRNISTALMRSWDARGDTFVWDEPFYAHYLLKTGVDHPGRDEIVRAHETDWRKVAGQLMGSIPEGKSIFYQKHMAHHLLPHMRGDWIHKLSHGFLIRDPQEMLISLDRVFANPAVEDTGLPQQLDLFQRVRNEMGGVPPVVDARDVLLNPEVILERLCAAFSIPFTRRMLSWASGPRPSDGVWARHWYGNVRSSTGFRAYEPPDSPLPDRLRPVYERCLPIYQQLFHHRITA